MHFQFLVKFDQNEYFITFNIFVLKGDLNGKIEVVRFFFCRVYVNSLPSSGKLFCLLIIFANCKDTADRHNVVPDPDPNCLTL